MSDTSINARDPSTSALFPLKLYDNGDGTYSLLDVNAVVVAIVDTADHLDHLLGVTDGATSTLNASNTVDGSIIAKLASKTANGAAPENFNCETDSLEAISDKIGAFTGDGGTAQDDSVKASLDLLHTSKGKVLLSMDFWSAPVEEISVDGDAGTLAAIATTVVSEVPGTFVRAIGMFKFRAVENTYAGVNKLDGATVAATSQVIQIDDAATTGYVDCITFVDDMFTLAASTREGGDVIIGSIDVAARVDGNDTYTWRWLLSKADQDDINFNDVQFGIRVWYSI